MTLQLTSAKTLRDAAVIHCRYWNTETWEAAVHVRDHIINELDPEWPHEAFWSEVDKLAPRPA